MTSTAADRMTERVYYRPSRTARHFWPISSYLVTVATVTVLWVLFFVLNRTVVRGREHVGEQPTQRHNIIGLRISADNLQPVALTNG